MDLSPKRPSGSRVRRVRVGSIEIDPLTFDEAIDAVDELVERRQGGTVFTPNVDHVVQVTENEPFLEAYRCADLSLVDGMPVLWAARALGNRLPEKISGSDLVRPVMARAAYQGWRVYLLGATRGVMAKAKAQLMREYPSVNIVGAKSPDIDTSMPGLEPRHVIEQIRAARPDLLLLGLGTPKQEIWGHRIREAVKPAVILGVGASFDFIAGEVKRAPRWVSQAGFEWLYRLGREPRRLWRRYLLRDPKFLAIVIRQALAQGA
jgi:N-acetylglucosaminyldiphosphoundecaprenol N-acetyl-beta-D-mannosaminyltransferase